MCPECALANRSLTLNPQLSLRAKPRPVPANLSATFRVASIAVPAPAATLRSVASTKELEVPRPFRTVHPLGWATWKGEFLAPTEEELLTGIQGRGREDGDRDVASDRQSSEGARDQRR